MEAVLRRLLQRGAGGGVPSQVGLANTQEVLVRIMGDEALRDLGKRTVHIVGTNGKGSLAWRLAPLLGPGTALLTSPHLLSVRERIREGHSMVSEADFVAAAETVLAAALPASSYFELLTCIGLVHAASLGGPVVLEAGMGGRGDATSALPCSRVLVLTSVGMDHTPLLGTSHAEVCREKLGAAKAGTRVVIGEQVDASLMPVAMETCRENECASVRWLLGGTDIDIDLVNNRLAIEVAKEFFSEEEEEEESGRIVNEDSRPPARMQVLTLPSTTTTVNVGLSVVLDVGHNPEALERVVKQLQNTREIQGKSEAVLVFGIAQDKDVVGSLRALQHYPNFQQIYFVKPEEEKNRSLTEPAILKEICEEHGFFPNAKLIDSSKSIWQVLTQQELGGGSFALVCGSHSLMKEAYNACGQDVKTNADPFDMNEASAMSFATNSPPPPS